MAVCLNTASALVLYKELVNSEYFVDKSDMIEKITLDRKIFQVSFLS